MRDADQAFERLDRCPEPIRARVVEWPKQALADVRSFVQLKHALRIAQNPKQVGLEPQRGESQSRRQRDLAGGGQPEPLAVLAEKSDPAADADRGQRRAGHGGELRFHQRAESEECQRGERMAEPGQPVRPGGMIQASRRRQRERRVLHEIARGIQRHRVRSADKDRQQRGPRPHEQACEQIYINQGEGQPTGGEHAQRESRSLGQGCGDPAQNPVHRRIQVRFGSEVGNLPAVAKAIGDLQGAARVMRLVDQGEVRAVQRNEAEIQKRQSANQRRQRRRLDPRAQTGTGGAMRRWR
ncbi:MAG: hypothetical protein BWZ10_01174 [candidate division BRC1 bacterium ADurb.BinA364]|nr:MAG: hypothetical protein BWZ10_01174 [candidate division BRC1 bacterium ADurb.BinA364]